MSDTITIPARRGKAASVAAGQAIRVINAHGEQVVDTWAFNRSTESSPSGESIQPRNPSMKGLSSRGCFGRGLHVSPVWVPEVRTIASGNTAAMEHAVKHVQSQRSSESIR